jgi:uncharacterized protein (DUF924 family)
VASVHSSTKVKPWAFGAKSWQLAQLLLTHHPDEHAEALEHLDFAIAEFREMKMQPALERALRHKEVLKA